MRILLLNSFPPPLGGAEAHAAMVRDLLIGAGHEASLVAPGEAPGRVTRVMHRFQNLQLARELDAAFRSDPPDLVHVHNFLRTLSTTPFRVAARHGIPTVWTAHDYQLFCPRTWAIRADGGECPRPELLRCLVGNCWGGLQGLRGRATYAMNTLRCRRAAAVLRRHVTRVVAPAPALADRLAEMLGRPVDLVPHPFPEVTPPAAGSGQQAQQMPGPEVLFLGRVSAEKGVEPLLRALAEVPGVTLTMAGEGPQRRAMERLATGLGLDDRVRWLGWVGPDALPELFATHRTLVLPSLCMENVGMSMLEALAAGVPVLGARRGGIPGFITHGRNGWLLEPGDPADFAAALVRVRDLSPAAWQEMSAAARAGAAGGGQPVFLERLLQVYRRALGDG